MAMDLAKPVGPLPLGAWIAVVGGGLGLAWYSNRGTSSAAPQVSTGTDPGVGVGGGTPGFLPSPEPTPTAPADFADNDAWARAALNYLVTNNNNPTAASIAVRKYVDGQSLTVAEDSMIKAALKGIGTPPIIPIGGGLIPNTPTTPIPPSPTNAPPGIWVVATAVNPSTATLQGMAKRFLGAYAGWAYIYLANKQGTRRPDGSIGMVPVSGQIKPGWRIWIPGGKYAP